MKNRKNNKGFSLVELIVVVAIMAVLVGVLAPAYLRYVEKSRLQKDNSAIAEIAQAMKIAAADETINTAIGSSANVTFTDAGNTAAATITFTDATNCVTVTALGTELSNVIGTTYTTTSNAYKTATDAPVLTITIDGNGAVAVTGVNIIAADGTVSTSTNPTKF